jgi:hypothetical protein
MENKPTTEHNTGRVYRTTVILLLVIIVVGFGVTFGIRYLYEQSRDPHSLLGQAWIDIHTTSNSDTDGDGLSDGDEDTYHTNFWETDTDKDSYPDGQEIRTKHNPTGPGNLSEQYTLDLTKLKL